MAKMFAAQWRDALNKGDNSIKNSPADVSQRRNRLDNVG